MEKRARGGDGAMGRWGDGERARGREGERARNELPATVVPGIGSPPWRGQGWVNNTTP